RERGREGGVAQPMDGWRERERERERCHAFQMSRITEGMCLVYNGYKLVINPLIPPFTLKMCSPPLFLFSPSLLTPSLSLSLSLSLPLSLSLCPPRSPSPSLSLSLSLPLSLSPSLSPCLLSVLCDT